MSAILEPTHTETAYGQLLSTGIQPVGYLQRKKKCVRVLGVLLGTLLAPVILLLIAAVRVTSPGPGLYRQTRVGQHGREFTIYKLRSMRQDAEKRTGPVWAAKKDHRVTPLGRLLRWTHLDELPQIINVIRGEMDFVGPRPERPEIVADLIQQVPGYLDRLEAMPGITGSAQVNLQPDRTVGCVRDKVAADRHYIQNASLWLDLRLVIATALRLLGVRYEQGANLLWVALPDDAASEAGAEAVAKPSQTPETNVAFGSGWGTTSPDDTCVDLASLDTMIEAPEKDKLTAKRPATPQPRLPR